MRVIGIVGPAGVGKTEVARILEENGYRRERMADTLKRMLREFGLSLAQVDGHQKEVPTPLLCGKTPRWAMQTLGTEWGRDLIGEGVWVAAMLHRLSRLRGKGVTHFVVDDIRFPNEVAMIQALSGEVWRVVGRNMPKPPSRLDRILGFLRLKKRVHPSELYWSRITPDREIHNTGTLDDLRRAVAAALKEDTDDANL